MVCRDGVARVVDQHRHPATVLSGERAHPAYVLVRLGVGVLDPRDAADHVGAEVDRLADQVLRAGVAQQAVLRERHDLQVDHAAELLAQREQRDHALEPGLGVDVGERQHVAYAVPDRLEHGLARVGLDPAPVVAVLHRGGELDRVERRAHVTRGVRREGGVADPVQRVDLVEVHVPVDEALGDQGARGVDLLAAGERRLLDRGDDRRRRCRSASGRTGRGASRPRRRARGWARFDSIGRLGHDRATAQSADERLDPSATSAIGASWVRRRAPARCRCRRAPGRTAPGSRS